MHIYEGVGRAFDCEVGNSDGEHARATTDTASEEEYEQVRIARGFDLKRTQMIGTDCDVGPSGRGKKKGWASEGPTGTLSVLWPFGRRQSHHASGPSGCRCQELLVPRYVVGTQTYFHVNLLTF